MSAATAAASRAVPLGSAARRNAWTLGLLGFLAFLLVFTKLIQPSYGVTGVQGLAISVLPLALAAVAQAIVVISGGIDLSIGSMMALTSVVTASLMKGQSEEFGIAVVVIGVLLLGLALGAINGGLVVVTRVPDIVVTLAMSFVWAGCALLVLKTPGGGSAKWLKDLVVGSLGNEWIPKAAVVLLVIVAVIWIPGPAVAARPVDLRDRQQPAGGLPERRAGRPDEGLRVRPDRPVRGARRASRSRRAPGSGRRSPGPTRCRAWRPSSSAASASPAAGAASSVRSSPSSSSR